MSTDRTTVAAGLKHPGQPWAVTFPIPSAASRFNPAAFTFVVSCRACGEPVHCSGALVDGTLTTTPDPCRRCGAAEPARTSLEAEAIRHGLRILATAGISSK